MSKEYQFYQLMEYTTPYHKEFFGYFSSEQPLIWWEPLKLSRAKPCTSLEKLKKQFEVRWNIWKYIPFVEMVCITWKLSFNQDDDWVWLWIIASPNRMRFAYIIVKIILFFQNQKWKKNEDLAWRIDALQESSGLDIQFIKEWEYDVIPVYQCSHLSICYQKYNEFHRSFYEQNSWVKNFLPNFPNQFVIWCGLEPKIWQSGFARKIESYLSNSVWNVINFLSKQIVLLTFMIWKFFKGSSIRILDWLIRRDVRQKDEVLLRRKVFRRS